MDPSALARIRALAIPPAWRDVWICPDPLGHLQATGVDAAGRRQYRYHDLWSRQQAHAKFEHMVAFAHTLPTMRERVLGTMRAGHVLNRERVLSCSVRLLDVGMFRIGSEVYEKEDGHLGLATIAKANVSIEKGRAVFDYVAKEGVRRVHAVADPCCVEIVGALKRRRGGGEHLLAFRERQAWHQVHAPLINEHLKSLIGNSFSAKNFRTWNGTLLAAVALARSTEDPASDRARRRAIRQATIDVSEALGNTPAVARGPTSILACSIVSCLAGPSPASCDASTNGAPRKRSVGPLSSWPCSTCLRCSHRHRRTAAASPPQWRWRCQSAGTRPAGPGVG